jgi:hypothetical protein
MRQSGVVTKGPTRIQRRIRKMYLCFKKRKEKCISNPTS